jgi:hypothetical protein
MSRLLKRRHDESDTRSGLDQAGLVHIRAFIDVITGLVPVIHVLLAVFE